MSINLASFGPLPCTSCHPNPFYCFHTVSEFPFFPPSISIHQFLLQSVHFTSFPDFRISMRIISGSFSPFHCTSFHLNPKALRELMCCCLFPASGDSWWCSVWGRKQNSLIIDLFLFWTHNLSYNIPFLITLICRYCLVQLKSVVYEVNAPFSFQNECCLAEGIKLILQWSILAFRERVHQKYTD